MSNCDGCNQLISVTDKLTCASCSGSFHCSCVGITKVNYSKLSTRNKAAWKCPECRSRTKIREDTPVKSNDVIENDDILPLTPDKLETRLTQLETSLINKLKTEIATLIQCQLKAVLDPIRKEIERLPGLTKSIEFMSNKFDEINTEVSLLRSESKKILTENENLQNEIKNLNFRLSLMEQQARDCNLDLQYLSENSNENLVTVVTQLAKVVSCPLQKDDIRSCSRVAKSNRESTRPRSVIIKLASPRIRDNILATCWKYNKAHESNKLNNNDLGIGGEKKPIFISEHLSLANRALHFQARIFREEHQFKYLWIRNGKVLLKKDDHSPSVWVKNSEILEVLRINKQILIFTCTVLTFL